MPHSVLATVVLPEPGIPLKITRGGLERNGPRIRVGVHIKLLDSRRSSRTAC
jgi:hypothetical protein